MAETPTNRETVGKLFGLREETDLDKVPDIIRDTLVKQNIFLFEEAGYATWDNSIR